MLCVTCGNEIPAGRLAAIPNAKQCVVCKSKNDEPMKVGHMVYPHKTGSFCEIVDAPTLVKINRMDRRGYKHVTKEEFDTAWKDTIFITNGKNYHLDHHVLSGHPGWLKILHNLLVDLIALGWNREIRQIKEKFGGLRVYLGISAPLLYARTDQAEGESLKTCSKCGGPYATQCNIRKGSWVRTLCAPCRDHEESCN